MGGAENDPADHAETGDGAGPPLTVELLADLQAGLLADADAARVRGQIRVDPAAQHAMRALNQVRYDVAALATDTASASDAPPAVVTRVRQALRSAASPVGRSGARRRAVHSVRPGFPPARVVAAVAGAAAVIAGIAVGTAALVAAPAPMPSAPTTAQRITVPPRATTIPLTAPQLLGLLDRSPDYGALSDSARRSSCLIGLGYPESTRVLGAQPVEINGRPAVLLVLPGDVPDVLAAVAVAPNCSSADTGLLVETVVRRP
jgi:hypothetical protein